jgi:hypothetical protein
MKVRERLGCAGRNHRPSAGIFKICTLLRILWHLIKKKRGCHPALTFFLPKIFYSSGRESDHTLLYGVNLVFRRSLDDSKRSLTGHYSGDRLALLVDGELPATLRNHDPIRTARAGLLFATEAPAIARDIIHALVLPEMSIGAQGDSAAGRLRVA